MSLTADLVLPEDVLLIPVADLDAGLREELGDPDGFAVTRPRGRATSSLVGPEVAELLNEFRSPTTVVAAVLRYSSRHGLDPRVTLDQAYPALSQCLGEGFLVPPDRSAASEIVASVQIGAVVAGATVQDCVRVLDDTEVYRAVLPDGALVAIKLARESGTAVSAQVRDSFAREAQVLTVLDGGPAPRLLDDGSGEQRPYLVLEWCDGLPATGVGRLDAAAVLLAVLDAYAVLHGRGVLHGDVHPGNVLVDSAGRVRLVDFGLATAIGLAGKVRRGGLQHYFEPELAAATLARRRPPEVSVAGEVFSLGALGYELLTGRPWIDLGLDSDQAMSRIVERMPVPFRDHRVHGHAELERALHAALAKDPGSRPESVEAFAELVRTAIDRDRTHAEMFHGVAGRPARRDAVDAVLASVLPGGELSRTDPAAPTASLNYGAAGVAMALLRISSLRADPDLLTYADGWAERAHRLAGAVDAFVAPDLGLDEEAVGDGTPYHRASGVALTRALVAHAAGNTMARQAALDDYAVTAAHDAVVPDLTLGSGGALLGAALLLEAISGDPYANPTALRELGGSMAGRLWESMESAGDIASSSTISALGIAHGWAGLLLASLRWADAVGDRPPDGLADRLDQLAALAETTANGVRWRWTNRSGPAAGVSVPGWCNGTAGHLMLWTQAFRSLGDQRHLELAVRAGDELVASAGGPPQLCCGAPGQAYALLDLYRITGERATLQAAHRIAEQVRADLDAGAAAADPELIPASLYRGPLGAAVLLCELDRPELAAMPAFGLEGW